MSEPKYPIWNKKLKEQYSSNGWLIPQKICPFLYWNTRLVQYECTECNNECGGCRYAGYANDDGTDWEIGLEWNKLEAER